MFSINNVLNRRSFLAGAAAFGSTAALAGCSSGGSDGGSADDGKTFKIGVIGPLTGAAATYGVSAEKGAKLAAKDFSTKDLKLSLKSEDDVADGEKAINAFNTLCDWGMQALVGPVTTGAAVAVSGEIADDMLMVTPSASSLDVTKDKTTVFQVCFTDPTMGASAAKFLAEKYADAKIALFYNSGDTYSSGVADAFAEQAKASKLDIVDTETFKDDSSTSFTNQLTKAKEVGATLIFAPIYYTPASVLLKNAKDMGYDMTLMGTDGMDGLLSVEGFDTSLAEGVLLKNAKDMGYDVKMMGCDGMDGILGVEGFDTSLAEGLLLMTPFSADDEKNADFVNAYKDKYGDTPDQFAADAYDGVHAVAEAVKEAGLGVDADPTEVAEKLSKAMLKITVDGLTGKLTWNDKGQVQKEPTAYVITDGKYVQA